MSKAYIDRNGGTQYFEHFRGDVIDVVPADAKYVLSVGCAAGRTEAELVNRGVKVVGVEIDPLAAQKARERGLTILEGDVAVIDINVSDEPYDCLVYADVLEHLREPVDVLKRHVKHLKPNGIVYVCVPNFRCYSVFWQLFVRGYARYSDEGVLDRTHIRITTRKMVLEWFRWAGIKPVSRKYFIHRRRDKLASVFLFGLAKEFIATQVGLVGTKR
ncbi:MAG TPA: class I SAM-dependent methyltransferase [Planctomycetes bacterium]|nr:class I SAM-dependent methyltransferase [Planctomycetota bacterium]